MVGRTRGAARAIAAAVILVATAAPALALTQPPALQAGNLLSEIKALGTVSQATARANLGLGTLATQNASAVTMGPAPTVAGSSAAPGIAIGQLGSSGAANIAAVAPGGGTGQTVGYDFYPTFGTNDGVPRRAAQIQGRFNAGGWGTETLDFLVGNNGASPAGNLDLPIFSISGSGTASPNPLPLNQGGTGATTPAAARANLGFNALNTFGVVSGASGGLGGPWGASGQLYSFTGTTNGSGSGGIGMMFDASHAIGYLGVIAPGSAWLPLYLQGSTFSLLSGGSTQGLYQDATGRVGIGNTTPSLPLDVTGAGRVSGNFGVGGLSYRSTAPGVSAAGTTQATATALTFELNVVTTAASSSGVQLAAASGGSLQAQQQVFNRGANALLVYPPSGAGIEAGAANAAVSLAVGAHATFTCVSSTQCYQGP